LRVMIVEDHWVWADAVAYQLRSLPGVTVVGIAASVDDALELAREKKPRVAFVDILLGDESGLQVARILRGRHPEIGVVIITSEPTVWAVEQARACGVRGVVSKDDLRTREDIHEVLTRAASGVEFFSPSVPAPDPSGALTVNNHHLTAVEIQIIRGLDRGLGTAEIAQELLVAQQTVRNRVASIGKKLGASGRIEIRAKAQALGILTGGSPTE
jgi:DNA-binding NarL/FixJ family response regulator